jgi:hypothetical protein
MYLLLKRTIFLNMILLWITSLSYAQNTFYQSFNVSNPENIIQTQDNSFACVTGEGILKLDQTFQSQFCQQISLNTEPRFHHIAQTTDNDYIICTRYNQNDNAELCRIARFDQHGNYLWSKRYVFPINTSVQTHDIISSDDNGFYILGSGCVGAPILIRCDQYGNIIWQRTTNAQPAQRMIRYSENKLLLAGTSAVDDNNFRINLFMADTAGNFLWFRQFTNNKVNYLTDIINTGNNEFALLVNSRDNSQSMENSSNSVIRIDGSGNMISVQSIYSTTDIRYHEMNSLAHTSDQGFLFTGSLALSNPGMSILMAKTDVSGQIQWSRYFGNMAHANAGTNEGLKIFNRDGEYYLFAQNEDGLGIARLSEDGSGFCNDDNIQLMTGAENYSVLTANIQTFSSFFIAENIAMEFSSIEVKPVVYCSTGSIITTIDANIPNAEEMTCYPNPASEQITVEAENILSVMIFNMQGQLVKSTETGISNSYLLNLSELPRSTYILQVMTANGVYVRKIMLH